ncbi:AraC family transcriptional regulator [Stagnimonas aquatica]|nr:AraC family transcriptional regulator [Stagnimonas aquatica]
MRSVLRRPCLSALLLLEFAAERGLAPEQALAGTGLELSALKVVGASIDSRDELTLIASVLRQLGNPPGLGLAMGQRYHLTAYGLWGLALLNAPTLRSALETGLRYLDLTYSYLQLRLRDEGSQTRVIFDASEVPENLRRFLLERDTAALAVIQRELFAAQSHPYHLRFALPTPADLEPYRRLFGVVPEFNCAETALLLPSAQLDAALPLANPLAAQVCEAQCRQLLAERRSLAGVSAQVRDRLLRGFSGKALPDMEALAAELHLSSRTLRRHLQREGSSYRELVEEVRQTLAEELLGGIGMKVDEAAARLGYSEAASLLHARKRWRRRAGAEASASTLSSP